MSNDLILKGAIYSSYGYPFRKKLHTIDACWQEVNDKINHHLDLLTNNHDGYSKKPTHVLCSTINSTIFIIGESKWEVVKNKMVEEMLYPPSIYIDAYECASWGYALRYCLNNDHIEQNDIIITIIDIDFNDLSMWVKNPPWGKSGFGICTLLFEPCGEAHQQVSVGCAKSSSAITEFGFAIRKFAKSHPNTAIAVPFFETSARKMLKQILLSENTLPDLHEIWGHCFGSDPWISIIKNLSLQNMPNKLLVSSYALNGYFAIASISLEKEQGIYVSV